MNDESEQPKRSSIADLERLLDHDDEIEIEILPNGEVRSKPSSESLGPKKPLTFRDNLGGEYGNGMVDIRCHKCGRPHFLECW